MASPWNQHCANCIGTLSFPVGHDPVPRKRLDQSIRRLECGQGKASPYSITERRVAELIPVEPAGDVSHKPGGRLPLLSARPEITIATLKTPATNFAAW